MCWDTELDTLVPLRDYTPEDCNQRDTEEKRDWEHFADEEDSDLRWEHLAKGHLLAVRYNDHQEAGEHSPIAWDNNVNWSCSHDDPHVLAHLHRRETDHLDVNLHYKNVVGYRKGTVLGEAQKLLEVEEAARKDS